MCKEIVCFLAWNELSIDSQIYYDRKFDRIIGFEDWGNARTNKFADHALVSILRGIHRNWIISVSYNLCTSSSSAKHLGRCIREIVRAVSKAGFKIVASVYDQGTTYVSCINFLFRENKTICLSDGTQFIKYSHLHFLFYFFPSTRK